jgi:GR25 family glycosyltransferase involved in LPS biosynthesis
MNYPESWNDFLDTPVFLINLEHHIQKRELSIKRIKAAGFTNITVWKGIDASKENMTEAWKRHGSPRFNPNDGKFLNLKEHPYKQGTLISHLDLWKHIIDNNIPYAIIFEDDIVFHKDWHILAPKYFSITPKDYGLCYIGHHCGEFNNEHVVTVPLYTTHAFIMSLQGAKCLYYKMINDEVWAIDCLINSYMCKALYENDSFCQWYSWNAKMFPDNQARKHPDHIYKDIGLVFQENI